MLSAQRDLESRAAAAIAAMVGNNNSTSDTDPFLSDGATINTGVANSALGDGTTLPELDARMRFINVVGGLIVVTAYCVPTVLTTTLFLRPLRLSLALAIGALALLLVMFEVRIPALSERIARTFGVVFDSAHGRGAAFVVFGMSQMLDCWLRNNRSTWGTASLSPFGWASMALGVYTFHVCLKFPDYARLRVAPEGNLDGIIPPSTGELDDASFSPAGYGSVQNPVWVNNLEK